MQIEFKRSGGMGPMTNVSGSATLTESGGEVKSADGKYHRSMDSEEAKRLLSSSGSTQGTGYDSAQLLDGFQYDIVSSTNGDNKQLKVNASRKPELQKLSAAEARLLGWVQHEAEKILDNQLRYPGNK